MDHAPARRLRRIVTVTVAAAGLAATTIPAAQADREGTTRVAVAPAVVAKLDQLNLTAAPVGNATAAPFQGTVALRFPVTDVKRDGNIIKHSGGARVSNGHEAIALKRFKIKLGAGKVGAAVVVNGDRVGRVEVFNLAESRRPALGDVRLTLTRAAAQAVNATFGALRSAPVTTSVSPPSTSTDRPLTAQPSPTVVPGHRMSARGVGGVRHGQ